MRPNPLTRLLWLAAMCATMAVVCAMSFVSAFNAHPDEKDHVGAGRYYMEYWDPPKVGDERARGAYSNYGVSYLNQLDAVYFFAGKFASVVKPLAGKDYLALRLFNVCLLGWLMLLFWRLSPPYRVSFLPLFISPQIWYIFSYFNGDALPLALSFLAVFLACRLLEQTDALSGLSSGTFEDVVASHATMMNVTGGSPGSGVRMGTLVKLGLVLGLLTVSKQNYYVFLAFFLCFWAVAVSVARRPALGLRQAALVLALLAGVLGLRLGVDAWVVGHQAPDAVYKAAEQLAAEDFKPSKQAEGKGFWGMNMRAQGLTFQEMFTKWNWHIWTQRTSFGVYGYMKIYAPLLFYRYITWMLYALLAAALLPVLLARPAVPEPGRASRESGLTVIPTPDALAGPATGRLYRWALAGMFLLFAALTVAQSFWHSWTADFQAQGRYFFPILGMLGSLLACFAIPYRRFQPLVWVVGACMWGMSIWSFVNVGLERIGR
ncbi:hypothetical protein [Fundidesulfovibrio soli]|uniref:hypothetical protein n=1 Tax=Fundidesulfovibrio soli TaxID=2922716 RepID=UPI001FAEA8A9|nr:hypothetical protein [Fundidesulfovibrio soli]